MAFTKDTIQRLEAFERYMRQRRYSESTIKTYLSMIRQFLGYFEQTPWDELTEEHVVQYNYEMFIRHQRSHSTQNQAINAIKLFYTLHTGVQIIPQNIERPRKRRNLPVILSKDEVRKIIQSTRNLKHKTLLSVVYSCGLRIGEALELKWSDISRDENLIYIREGKGLKDRRVPLPGSLINMLEAYYRAYRSKVYVFEGQHGGKYSYTSCQNVFRRAVKVAGIRKRVTLHSLRHSYATHLLESGVGLRYIQDILGHSNPKTTMLYTQVSGKRLSEIRSPLDDLDL